MLFRGSAGDHIVAGRGVRRRGKPPRGHLSADRDGPGLLPADAYHQSKALRPLSQLIAHRPAEEQPELGMVWMLPVGMKAGDRIPGDVLGAAVWLIDQDRSVIIHADDAEALRLVTIVACRFAGGGRA